MGFNSGRGCAGCRCRSAAVSGSLRGWNRPRGRDRGRTSETGRPGFSGTTTILPSRAPRAPEGNSYVPVELLRQLSMAIDRRSPNAVGGRRQCGGGRPQEGRRGRPSEREDGRPLGNTDFGTVCPEEEPALASPPPRPTRPIGSHFPSGEPEGRPRGLLRIRCAIGFTSLGWRIFLRELAAGGPLEGDGAACWTLALAGRRIAGPRPALEVRSPVFGRSWRRSC